MTPGRPCARPRPGRLGRLPSLGRPIPEQQRASVSSVETWTRGHWVAAASLAASWPAARRRRSTRCGRARWPGPCAIRPARPRPRWRRRPPRRSGSAVPPPRRDPRGEGASASSAAWIARVRPSRRSGRTPRRRVGGPARRRRSAGQQVGPGAELDPPNLPELAGELLADRVRPRQQALGLVEALQHRGAQRQAVQHHHGRPRRPAELYENPLAALDRLPGRRRPKTQARRDPSQNARLGPSIPRPAGVADDALPDPLQFRPLEPAVVDVGDDPPAVGEANPVADCSNSAIARPASRSACSVQPRGLVTSPR